MRSIYRRFLYLDGEEVLNALASIEGGDVDEVVRSVLKGAEGNAALTLSVRAAKISFGGKKSRTVSEEVRLKRTAHTAVGLLLGRLKEEDAILQVNEKTSSADLQENVLVEFSADAHLVPAPEADLAWLPEPSGWNSFLRALRGPSREDERSDRLEALAKQGVAPCFVVELLAFVGGSALTVALQCESQYLLAAPAEVDRRVTVVGQIEVVPGPDEVVTLETGSRGMPAHVVQESPESQRDVDERDPEDSSDAVPPFALVVRPLCIFK